MAKKNGNPCCVEAESAMGLEIKKVSEATARAIRINHSGDRLAIPLHLLGFSLKRIS